MTQPTPGPHSAGTQGTKIADCVLAPGALLLGMAFFDGDPDEDPKDEPGVRWISREEAVANARLWSAAGDLLAACLDQTAVEARVRALTEVIEDWTQATPDQITEIKAIGEEVRRLKDTRAAAIAKATGEATP